MLYKGGTSGFLGRLSIFQSMPAAGNVGFWGYYFLQYASGT